jgi:hypothetical protein
LQKSPSDFGALGGEPCNQPLLDWLAAEFVKRGFSMKEMHKLMVTSDTYKLASEASPELAAANAKTDPNNTYLWHFRLQRLEAEPIWDSILAAADELDLSVGGPSFEMAPEKHKDAKVADTAKAPPIVEKAVHRRAAYIARGYLTSRDVMPAFLKAFDADDGRAPCPMRLQTVTAPQSLFLMNSPEIDQASKEFGERLHQASGTEPKSAVDLAYRIALARPPSPTEQQHAVDYLAHEPGGYKGLAWLLFNMDEFVYVR